MLRSGYQGSYRFKQDIERERKEQLRKERIEVANTILFMFFYLVFVSFACFMLLSINI